MERAEFSVCATPGKARVVVNGDVVDASRLTRVSFDASPTDLPRLYLEFTPTDEVVISGVGIVEATRSVADPVAAVDQWLSGIDPQALETAMLEQQTEAFVGLGVGAAVLAVLREWVTADVD